MRPWLSSMQHQRAASDGEMGPSNVRLTQCNPRPVCCLGFAFVSTEYCPLSSEFVYSNFSCLCLCLGPLRIVHTIATTEPKLHTISGCAIPIP